MSNYYQYEEALVNIALRLFNIDGWHVYGWHDDESDAMTDYYDPASWDGTAERNGYILVVNKWAALEKDRIYYKHNTTNINTTSSRKYAAIIEKLSAMTMARGASAQEEATARAKIEKLRAKMNGTDSDGSSNETATGEEYIYEKAHQANPPRCNWHIEKNGVIVAKGSGILNFSGHYDAYKYGTAEYTPDYKKYIERESDDQFKEYWKLSHGYGYFATGDADTQAEYALDRMRNAEAELKKFDAFIDKITAICGGTVGNRNDLYTYETVKVTEYKKENKAFTIERQEPATGLYFRIGKHAYFTYGISSGMVYKINEVWRDDDGNVKEILAYRMNGKLTKMLTGSATAANRFMVSIDKFNKWMESGAIESVKIEEVKTPYIVEKTVKKYVNAGRNESQEADKATESDGGMKYTVEPSKHTKTGADIWLVRFQDALSKETFNKVRTEFRKIGGYYSRFTHSFIFNYDPTGALKEAI